METERRSQRYPSDQPLQLRCETWTEFVEAYARDVCRGGMFVRTDEAPEVLSAVEIRLQLPDESTVTWSARVVHVITPEQAAAQQRPAGMGVEFTNLDAEQKRQLQQLVEFARSQHEHADPNASFTRALLENTPPMAASEVGARLSMRASSGAVDAPGAARSSQSQRLPAVRLEGEAPAAVGGDSSDASQRRVLRPASQSLQRMLAVRPPSGATPARPQTGPLAAAPARAQSGAVGAAPRRPATGPLAPPARPQSAPLDGGAASSGRRAPSGPLAPGARPNTGPLAGADQAGHDSAAEGAPPPPARPTDMQRLKLVLNALAHKHYDDAARIAREMLAENPGDPQVLKWQAICFARMQLSRGDQDAAGEQYARALEYDPGNREARDFVRDYARDRKLHALPFGRYFTKKK